MFSVHVVDAQNRTAYRDALEEHHRLRHQIYVGERRWMALERPDGREVDQFDTPAATYLLGLHPGGGVVAGSRLVPTTQPHLMSEVFPELAALRGLPRAPDIYEWTRIFVAPAWRERGRPCRAAGRIYAGLVEFALARSIRQLSVVCEAYWIARLAELDWRPRALGEPIEADGMTIVGITVDMTRDALERTRAVYGLDGPVLADDDFVPRSWEAAERPAA
jgi:acyl-homoserine lactone synthase